MARTAYRVLEPDDPHPATATNANKKMAGVSMRFIG
jgi:hypothetical protein